jgi:hypothetical protein
LLVSAEPPGALPAILLEASPIGHRHHGARHDRLAGLLRDEGWDARIAVNRSERRSAVTELVVRLLDQTGCAAVDALVPLLAGL